MFNIIMEGMLALFISFSVRTAKIEPNPLDYQLAFGVENKYFESDFEYERENGLMYLNLINKITPHERVSLSQKYIGARKIDSQTLTLKQPFKHGHSVFLALNAQAWTDARILIGYQLNLKEFGKVELSSNFSDRTIIDLKLKKPFLIAENYGLYLEPLLVYSLINDKVFWQAKVRLKIDFKTLLSRKTEEVRETNDGELQEQGN